MSKVKVLFFAADPASLSGDRPRLQLDEEVRQIRKRVEAAVFGNMLEFDWRLATRTRDLQQKLEDTRPRVVHFSGHGGSRGLVLTGADGRTPRPVDTEVLRELFQKDAASIRLVVLTACHSRAHAQAICEVVGCAIGTRGTISDDASITFNAKFYSAIATGRSVQDAFERARVALRMEHPAEGDILELHHREDVDPGKIVLVSRFRRYTRVGVPAAAVALTAALAATLIGDPPEPPSGVLRLGDCTAEGAQRPAVHRPMGAAAMEPGNPSDAATALAQAKSFCHAGEHDSAVAYFKRAADEGEPEAMSFLGIAYLSGEGTARDSVRGMHWLSQGAKEMRDPHGMNALAVVYENDQGMHRRYYLARHWYTEAAELGHTEAMRNLGRHYRMGLGLDLGLGRARRDSIALEWYRRAVAAGSVDALADIGGMHEQGLGGRRDVGEAIRWYRQAAAAGSPQGMYAMGRVYQGAVGVPRDYEQARAWFLQAACAGSASAMNELGILYEQGLGVAADRGKAMEWFRRAAAAGSPEAARNVAWLKPRGIRTVFAALDRPPAGLPAGCAAPLG